MEDNTQENMTDDEQVQSSGQTSNVGSTKPTPTPPPTKTTSANNDNVTIKRSVWEDVVSKLSRVEELLDANEQRLAPHSRDDEGNMGKKVKVHLIDGKLVTAYGRTHKRKDEDGNPCLYIELFTEDDKIHVVHLLDYFNDETNHQLCTVKEEKVRKTKDQFGTVRALVVDFDGYRSFYGDKDVAVEVVYKKRDFVVDLADGREVTVNESAVN